MKYFLLILMTTFSCTTNKKVPVKKAAEWGVLIGDGSSEIGYRDSFDLFGDCWGCYDTNFCSNDTNLCSEYKVVNYKKKQNNCIEITVNEPAQSCKKYSEFFFKSDINIDSILKVEKIDLKVYGDEATAFKIIFYKYYTENVRKSKKK